MKKFFPLALAIGLLCACGPSQDQDKSTEGRAEDARKIEELEARVAELQSELEDLRFGAERLLAQAEAEIDRNDYEKAKILLAELLKRHPDSPQGPKAAKLVSQVDRQIAESERLRKQEAERAAKERERALERALGNMKKTTDEFEGITWFRHRNSPVLGNYISAYFGTKNGSAEGYPLRVRLQYYGDNWLFVRSVTIKADERVFELGAFDFDRDNAAGSVWEWIDIPVKDHAMLSQIMAADRVVIRFTGDQYRHDFEVPASQKLQLREVDQAWRAMNGKP